MESYFLLHHIIISLTFLQQDIIGAKNINGFKGLICAGKNHYWLFTSALDAVLGSGKPFKPLLVGGWK